MRGKKAIINVAMGLLEEVVAVVCGFILPRLILSAFGSKYNGLTASITQFLACAVILRSGIGGATKAALYKPLANKNKQEVDAIMNATEAFMRRIGLILAIGIMVFAAIYPFFVRNEFEWLFTFTLFIIIGASTFAESFFGITYLILLQADQRLWVSSLMRIVCYILNTVVAALLIVNGHSIHFVKLGSAVIYVLYPIALRAYTKRKYRIDSKVEPNTKALSQRWDAFWHQISVFVMENTDVIVLTVFSNMLEVSVYSVYNLVANGIRRAVTSFSAGIEAAFGNMIAQDESTTLQRNLSIVEYIFFTIATIVYSAAAFLILHFVGVYTKGIADVNYIRPAFAYILLTAHFFNSVRLPYQMIVQAAGHFKQTKKAAMFEPLCNILLSVLLVKPLGLVGIAIGTLSATLFKTIYYSSYASKRIVKRSVWITLKRCLVAIVEVSVLAVFFSFRGINPIDNYMDWVKEAIMITMGSSLFIVIFNSIVFCADAKGAVRKLRHM